MFCPFQESPTKSCTLKRKPRLSRPLLWFLFEVYREFDLSVCSRKAQICCWRITVHVSKIKAALSASPNAHNMLCSVTNVLASQSSPSIWSVWEHIADQANKSCVWSSNILGSGPLTDWPEIFIVPTKSDVIWQLVSLAVCFTCVLRSAAPTSFAHKVSVVKHPQSLSWQCVATSACFYLACCWLVTQMYPRNDV